MDVLPHLKRFADDHLQMHGKREARDYLRACIAHWRQHYGDSTARAMESHIRGRYAGENRK